MKKLYLLLFITVASILLISCGNKVADEQQIQTDLEAYKNEDYFNENEKIIEIKIDKRKTKKDEKLDAVWCTVQTEDERCAYEKKFVLTYSLYDEGGWMLDNVSVNDKREWVITPVVGVSRDEISESLNGISITVDDEIWQVTQDKIEIISVDKQETDLEAGTDVVTVTIAVDDLVEKANGQLSINYTFYNKWIIDSISGNEDFTASVKPGLEFNITEETLYNAVSGESFPYGVGDVMQTIIINKDELSDLVIENHESLLKGTMQKYLCKCILKKPHAEFTLNIEAQYYYLVTWDLQSTSVGAECISVKVDGNWVGTMFGQTCELNITETDQDGAITGTFTHYDGAESYYVSGKIYRDTLYIELEAGDEIIAGVKIGGTPYGTSDIKAQLNVDDSTISGMARHNFVVAQ